MSETVKPEVKLNCPANAYAGLNERIVEVVFPGTKGDVYRQGCLISLRIVDGTGIVDVYAADKDVIVNGFRVGDGDPDPNEIMEREHVD